MLLPLLFAGVLAIGVDWRAAWIAAAVFLVAVGLPVCASLLAVERVPRGADDTAFSRRAGVRPDWNRAQVLADPLFWLTISGVLAPAFIGTTIFFHQDYLVALNGWSTIVFASGFTVMGVVTVVSGLATGVAVDRFSAVRVLPIFVIPLALSCLVVGTSAETWSIYAFFALLGLSYGMSQTMFGALWPEVYGTAHLGAIRSLVVAMMVFATAAGPGLTGWLIDRGVDLPMQMQFAAVASLAIGLLLLRSSLAYAARSAVAVPATAK